MGTINFLFGVHNHQPVGNFLHVFKEAFNNCYHPFLETLARYPKVRTSMHYSGPLLEWIEKNEKHHFDLLRELVKKKQVEILGGAFYEPILPIIPPDDAIGQIELMKQYIKEHFDFDVQGMWLAERVWEPQVVKTIKLSGIKYTIVDESHFTYAGLDRNKMFGYYIAEYGGETIGVFPIDKELRYKIPFKVPEETIDYLRRISAEYESKGVTIADDGEKFGLWPHTYKWVYEEKYLENLFNLLSENSSWIRMQHFNEYFNKYPSMGKVYLPNASYEEMMEWTLSYKAQAVYEQMMEDVKDQDKLDQYRPYLRGGMWRDFLVKYPESNLMYSKMWHISRKVNKQLPTDDEAKKTLWRAQCNCSYWHGLFGGLYLNYLRHAVYENFLRAEKMVDEKQGIKEGKYVIEKIDYNSDGNQEVLVSSKNLNLYFIPHCGGALFELDYKANCFNFSNVLARRKEFYHNTLLDLKNEDQSEGAQPKSIHDIVHSKEEGLENMLFYDWYEKYSFLDHFINEKTTFDNFYKCRYSEEGDFVNQAYDLVQCKSIDEKMSIKLKREGSLYKGADIVYAVRVEKHFLIDDKNSKIDAEYSITNLEDETIKFWFGSEMNFTLLAGNDKKRYFVIEEGKQLRLQVKKAASKVKKITLFDLWQNISLEISWKLAGNLWCFPVETVSQSEGGFERTYQGSTLFPNWKISLKGKESKKINLSLKIKKLK